MKLNEIKKELYKQNPKAHLDLIRKKKAYYLCALNEDTLVFEVPVDDMGDADFFPIMDAKLLIRYIVSDS